MAGSAVPLRERSVAWQKYHTELWEVEDECRIFGLWATVELDGLDACVLSIPGVIFSCIMDMYPISSGVAGRIVERM